jgi:hypothetical protein
MLNYTEQLWLLIRDIVLRVPQLSFIDPQEMFVFARFGRAGADGAFATCHSLNLPTSEPGYYFWRDRSTGELTRRSEWFVTKTPEVRIEGRRIKYLISFVLPRFCDQSLLRSRKVVFHPNAEPWMAKLDTVIHELYHIDPEDAGLRKFVASDGTRLERSHGPGFYEHVAEMVRQYLRSRPEPAVYDFLKYDFAALQRRHGTVVCSTFRNFPSFPQRYTEALPQQPEEPTVGVPVEPIRRGAQPPVYTERDLALREFTPTSTRRVGEVSVIVPFTSARQPTAWGNRA